MQDRPTMIELLQGVEYFLNDEAIARLEGHAKFHARVAANAVRMVMRELEGGQAELEEEYEGLAAVLGDDRARPTGMAQLRERVFEMNEDLAARIRDGRCDGGEFRARTLAHLRRVMPAKLAVANPKMTERVRSELAEPAG